MVAALPLAAKAAPVPAPPTAQVQPRGQTLVAMAALTAAPIVVIPPRPRDAAAAQLPAPPCVLAIAQPLVKGVSTPVKGLAKLHVMEVANNSVRVQPNITCKKHDQGKYIKLAIRHGEEHHLHRHEGLPACLQVLLSCR